MKRRDLLLAMAALGCLPQWVRAGGGGGFSLSGVSTEITQLANHAELVAQVAEAATQTATQIAQLNTMIQNLRQLNPTYLLNQMSLGVFGALGKSIADVAKVNEDVSDTLKSVFSIGKSAAKIAGSAWSAYRSINGIQREMNNFARSIDNFDHWMGQWDYMTVNLPKGVGGYYKLYKWFEASWDKMPPEEKKSLTVEGEIISAEKFVTQLQNNLKTVSDSMNEITEQAGRISDISGNIEGLQFLASQNASIQSLLSQSLAAMQQLEMMRKYDTMEQRMRDQGRSRRDIMRVYPSLDRLRI